jgi:23S rRNA C2498 (ribose-2'-O)-methylase RlmM
MDLLIALALFFAAVVGGIASNMIASELYDRAPMLARRLIRHAVTLLPESERENFHEEWIAHLDELSGNLSKFSHAFECWLRAAPRIVRELKEHTSSKGDLDETEQLIKKICLIYFRLRFSYLWFPCLVRGEFSKIKVGIKFLDIIFGRLIVCLLKAQKENKSDAETSQIIKQWRGAVEKIVAQLVDKANMSRSEGPQEQTKR